MRLFLIPAGLALAALLVAPPTVEARAKKPSAAAVKRGLAFARDHCSACHAVAPGEVSRNPESPPFEMVVNAPGLSLQTLQPWLRDSHNYPAVMDFRIEPRHIDDLAAYMITLRKPGYTPPSQ